MFLFSSKTFVNKEFKINELYKLIHANKALKEKSSNIVSIVMTNALSEQTTGLTPNNEVKEIYIFKIELSNNSIPHEFICELDKTIQFQCVYEVWYNNEVKYLTEYKFIKDGKVSLTKLFKTDWQTHIQKKIPLVSKLSDVYKLLLSTITNCGFKNNESIKEYLTRLEIINKKQIEIEKLTKEMLAEKQPNIKMELNDKIKKLKNELKELG